MERDRGLGIFCNDRLYYDGRHVACNNTLGIDQRYELYAVCEMQRHVGKYFSGYNRFVLRSIRNNTSSIAHTSANER